MGLLDAVRGRLGLGGEKDVRRTNDDYEVYDDDYDSQQGGYEQGYEDGYAQEDYDQGGYDDGSYDVMDGEAYAQQDEPAAMRAFGVDRADYYNDIHAPLISSADVRSHQIQTQAQRSSSRVPLQVPEQHADRIPAPRSYRRTTNNYAHDGLDEEALAFKDGLARGEVNSLTHLQEERLRLEDTGRFPEVPSGRVRSRGSRRIEYLRPLGYAEAEQVTRRLKGGSVVVLDLTQTRPELAKRILDFSFGVANALDGQVDRYADRVYVFTAKTALTSDERASISLGMQSDES